MDEIRLKDRLARENAEFRKLFEEHQVHERRLEDLKRKAFLSEAERIEVRELKKRKLVLKDGMYRIMREAGTSA
jgi:uncharacterized protein YdcH (DUF465 family)